MTDFKQIIGRGTRVSPEHCKHFFTILDYTGATELFYDPAFDGDPVQRITTEIDEMGQEIHTEDQWVAPEPLTYDEQADGTAASLPQAHEPNKYYLDDVQVYIIGQQAFDLDPESNTLRTLSFTDYVAEHVRRLIPDADHLQQVWPDAARRQEIIAELEKRGITIEELAQQTNRPDADPLDLLLHAAYHAPLLTRRERAAKMRQQKPNFFNAYEPAAREILDHLLNKYADFGVQQLEDLANVLNVPPFTQYGNVLEIATLFGGAKPMRAAVDQLKSLLYAPQTQP
jgi:type I restriction enzyme R subunit